jgi:hypothetical protein
VQLVPLGVEYDVLGLHFDELVAERGDAVLAAHPRTTFKTGIVEAFSAGIREAQAAAGTASKKAP